MLITDLPRTDYASSAATACDLRIRLLGGARDREIIPLALGNHSIGSGPRCTLRLRDAGVGPMHCLIAHTDHGVRVRRWSSDTLLNGQPFVESALVGGDYLSIGPIDLEIMASTSFESALPLPEMMPAARAIEDIREPEVAEPTEFDREYVEAECELNAWPHIAESLFESREPLEAEATTPDIDIAGIGFEILSALQSQREQFDALLRRVDELEKKVELVLADADEPKYGVVSEYSPAMALQPDDIAQISPFYSPSAMEDDCVKQVDESLAGICERADLVAQNASLEADLTTAQQQLADAIAELGAAQNTIDELQTRLAASQQSCQELSDEQATWQQQLAELEQQLAAHAALAEELQEQLRVSQLSASESMADATEIGEACDHESAPAWPTISVTDELAEVVDDKPEAGGAWSASEETNSPKAHNAAGYDWSTPVVDEVDEAHESSSADEGLDANHTWQTPWVVQETQDVASEEPACAAEDKIAADETNAAQNSIAESPVVEGAPIVAQPAPVRDTSSRLSGDIDEALAHLRELSIWRRVPKSTVDFVPVAMAEVHVAEQAAAAEPEIDVPMASLTDEVEVVAIEEPVEAHVEEDTTSVAVAEEPAAEPAAESIAEISTPGVDEPAAPTTAPATSSFIDRYAHMFEVDDQKEVAEPPAATADLKEIMQRRPDREAPQVTSVAPAAAASESHEADDSMEQYMARMMQRIRGDASAAPASKPASATTPAESNPSWKSCGDQKSAATSLATNNTTTASAEASAPPVEALISLQDLKRKEPTPEFSTDMGALRALANQTARHAIGIHTARTLRRNSRTKLIVAVLAAVTSLYFMLSADDWQSYEFSTGCVALFAAIYWGRLTFLSVIKAVKVGAFDDFDEDFTTIEAAKEALPIDVERR